MNKVELILNNSEVYVFDVCPCPAPRMTQRDKWADTPKYPRRECVKNYFNFKDSIVWTAKKINYQLTEVLNILFILPMPESWSNKKREKMLDTPHQCKPDRDNLLKAFQDAFGIDDSFVWNGNTTKVWGEKGEIIVYKNE